MRKEADIMKPLSLVAIVVVFFLILGAGTALARGEGQGHWGQGHDGRGFAGHDFGGHHGHGFRGDIWIGTGWYPWWGWGGYPYYYPYYNPYYYPYYDPYYYDREPVIIERAPYEYEAQQPQPATRYYWYFCNEPKGYYPYVRSCPGGWMKVLPKPNEGPNDGPKSGKE